VRVAFVIERVDGWVKNRRRRFCAPLMAISAVRTVYCDGGAGGVCPSSAQMTFRFPPSVALRLAVRKGWDATTGILCPSCCVRSVLPAPVVGLSTA
jgi:hypothetical protein